MKTARTISAIALVAVAAILSTIFWLALETAKTLNDTDHFVATFTPIATDANVQTAVGEEVSTMLSEQWLPQLTSSLLGDSQDNLAVRLVLEGLRLKYGDDLNSFVAEKTSAVMASAQFNGLWQETLRLSHGGIVALNKEGDLQDGALIMSFDVSPITDRVISMINIENLNGLIPLEALHLSDISDSQITVSFTNDTVFNGLSTYRNIINAPWWILGSLVLLFGLGVVLAVNRLKALAIFFAISAFLSFVIVLTKDLVSDQVGSIFESHLATVLAQSGLEQIYNNISVTYVTVGVISVAATLALCWLQARKKRLSL